MQLVNVPVAALCWVISIGTSFGGAFSVLWRHHVALMGTHCRMHRLNCFHFCLSAILFQIWCVALAFWYASLLCFALVSRHQSPVAPFVSLRINWAVAWSFSVSNRKTRPRLVSRQTEITQSSCRRVCGVHRYHTQRVCVRQRVCCVSKSVLTFCLRQKVMIVSLSTPKESRMRSTQSGAGSPGFCVQCRPFILLGRLTRCEPCLNNLCSCLACRVNTSICVEGGRLSWRVRLWLVIILIFVSYPRILPICFFCLVHIR